MSVPLVVRFSLQFHLCAVNQIILSDSFCVYLASLRKHYFQSESFSQKYITPGNHETLKRSENWC